MNQYQSGSMSIRIDLMSIRIDINQDRYQSGSISIRIDINQDQCQSTWHSSHIEGGGGGDIPGGILTAAVLGITAVNHQLHNIPDQLGFHRVPPVVTEVRLLRRCSEKGYIEHRELHLQRNA